LNKNSTGLIGSKTTFEFIQIYLYQL